MSAPSDPLRIHEFVTVAMEHALLSRESAEELSDLATKCGAAIGDLALEQGLLDAVEVDIVETLRNAGDTIPGYDMLGVLGRGGMGVVYRARQRNLSREVAVKTLLLSQLSHRDALLRFEQEARNIGQLQHPNIVAAYDYGKNKGRLYLAMELVPGLDLGHYIARNGALSERLSWQIARQIAAGLAHAQKAGIVHRDIKPANVLVVNDSSDTAMTGGAPLVKISDFGLSLLTTADEASLRLTQTGRVMGTPHFMAPEQLRGGELDARVDIYALGATVYSMLAGQIPFADLNITQVFARSASEPPPDVRKLAPHVSAPSAALVSAMMHGDRDKRIGDYRQLVDRIDDLLTNVLPRTSLVLQPTVELHAKPTPAQQKTTRALWSHRLFLGVIAVLFAVIGSSAYLAWERSQRPPVPRLVVNASGFHADLFDGESSLGWKTSFNAEHGAVKDGEGTFVLSVYGDLGRELHLPSNVKNYLISVGVTLQQADNVEMQFAVTGNTPLSDCLALRIEGTRVYLAQRRGDKMTIVGELAPEKARLVRTESTDTQPHTLRVERQSTHWFAYFDGQLVGYARIRGPERAECRLIVEDNRKSPAFFSDILVEELIDPNLVPPVSPVPAIPKATSEDASPEPDGEDTAKVEAGS